MHTTNYENTFVEIAEDSPNHVGTIPPLKGEKLSVANMQFEMLKQHPYEYTSDDVLFTVWADRKDITESERAAARAEFFSKGQACFRASPLTKQYGWGVHSDAEGKIALYPAGSEAYEKFLRDENVKKVKAMRSKRG